jgi:pimeloyl-ACP methyl ester carboxylesterase
MKLFAILSLMLAFTAGTSFAADSAAFQVKVTGHGRPMILIPGLASPGAVWDSTVAHFKDHYECHVISLAGFAGTPAQPVTGPLLAGVREELATYIRRLKLAHPVIVGHSLGGFLALDLAANHPDLAGQLVIVDSLPFLMGIMKPGATADDAKQFAAVASSSFSQMKPEAYAQMIRNGPNGSTMAASSADLDRIIAWGLASDPATVSRAMGELYSADLRPLLPKIKCQALVLAAWIGYAPYSNHQFAEQAYSSQYAGLADTSLKISDTARHFIMFDDPQWMFTQIENFLATPAINSVSSSK